MRRWYSLCRNERRLVLQAAVSLTVAVIGLRVVSLKRMLEWGGRPIGAGTLDSNQIRDRFVAVQRAGRVVPRGTCLAQALALARMLRKKGVPATVRIGVKADGAFAAHAWVETAPRGARLALCALRDYPDLDLSGYVAMDLHRDG